MVTAFTDSLLSVLLLLPILITPGPVFGQEPQSLERADALERQSQLEEAKRLEAELQGALEQLKARRVAVERELAERPRDAVPRSPEGERDAARIVNGVLTWGFPATGALIKGGSVGAANSQCTGTLVGCRTFLTANHCVERDRDPSKYFVYLQNAGIYAVEQVSPQHPEYRFPHADLAVLRLASQVEGITPMAVNGSKVVQTGTTGTLVGFGRSGGSNFDYGLKRAGDVTTATCTRPETSLLCWDFDAPVRLPGEDSNTCNADSGGPLFADLAGNGALQLAGVTSGGTRSNCLAGDHSYDVDVRQFSAWISEQAGDDLGAEICGATPVVGSERVQVFGANGQLGANQSVLYRLALPGELSNLRIALNGEDTPTTDFDLFARKTAHATVTDNDCGSSGTSQYSFCEFESPAADDWFIQVRQKGSSTGSFQLVVTLVGRAN